jgi:predicted lipoprotein
MNRATITIAVLLAAGVLSWFFPLFRVVSRSSVQAAQAEGKFNAAAFVDELWTNKLPPTFADAHDVAAVVAALRENPQQAKTEFGRTVGLGRSTLFFVQGQGTIISVDAKAVGISFTTNAKTSDVSLPTGLLFGNTVRDATGLVDGNEFPNSQQFNEISTHLNRKIEETVLPNLKSQAKVGNKIRFVGCSEVTNLPRDVSPLKVIPLQVRFEASP